MRMFYFVAHQITGDFHLAQDIAQETFIKAYRSLHTLKRPERLGSWLYAIVKRLSLNAVRGRGNLSPLSDFPDIPDAEPLEARIDRNDVRRQVRRALGRLDEASRQIVTLYFFGDLTMKEISRMLDMSEAAVESRLRRAKHHLKKGLLYMMEETKKSSRLDERFEESVMRQLVPRIAAIEIPVSDLRRAVAWYEKMIGAKAPAGHGDGSAMLFLRGGAGGVGIPSLYLVETKDANRLEFRNTRHGYVQSIIDFYTHDLRGYYRFLRDNGADVNEVDFDSEPNRQGFGFRDPDGNSLGVCNVVLDGQTAGASSDHRIVGKTGGHQYISRIASIEIPVANLKQAVNWYSRILGLKLFGDIRNEAETAMMYLSGGDRIGVPCVYLVQNDDPQRIVFVNTKTGITHSVFDFYVRDVGSFLEGLRAGGVAINGASGFFDPDGNSLAVCDALFPGQV